MILTQDNGHGERGNPNFTYQCRYSSVILPHKGIIPRSKVPWVNMMPRVISPSKAEGSLSSVPYIYLWQEKPLRFWVSLYFALLCLSFSLLPTRVPIPNLLRQMCLIRLPILIGDLYLSGLMFRCDLRMDVKKTCVQKRLDYTFKYDDHIFQVS